MVVVEGGGLLPGPPPRERPEQGGEAGRGGLGDGEGGPGGGPAQDEAQGAGGRQGVRQRCPAQEASGPGHQALHPPPKERPAKAWKESQPLRLPRAMGSGEGPRLAGQLPEVGGVVGAEGPCLPRLPTPRWHPHPAQSHFWMSSSLSPLFYRRFRLEFGCVPGCSPHPPTSMTPYWPLGDARPSAGVTPPASRQYIQAALPFQVQAESPFRALPGLSEGVSQRTP